jgi:hypothetical protein
MNMPLLYRVLVPTFFLAATVLAPAADTPPRLRRADSFLGIHFDFHAGPDCTEIGRNTTREMIENILDLVRPDYLQIDCKGHPGLSSYPTRVGNRAPGFVGDPLRLWREVTAERGVALYMHYSGVWDSEAIRQHPDWAALDADGSRHERATSFWSPYADQLLIPQLRELAGDYGVDGAWIDGECWASVPDYGEAALRAFRETTGIETVPRQPADPFLFEFMEFQREAFRRYVRHYLQAIRSTHPDFQLCSNWAFTDHMPEPVSAPLDFLSGDYSPDDSVNSARLSARYLARQGLPWDLMAWSFSRQARERNGQLQAQKTATQLQREAAIVLALGGGFQAYYKQKRDGSIFPEQMPVMAEVARFCRDRQPFCHRAEQVPQIALLFSTPAHYRRCTGLFSRELSRINGILQALLESQNVVEVLGEHHLTGRLAEYPLVIVPEWHFLEYPFREELLRYARDGGSLLLVGPESAALFEAELGITLQGEPSTERRHLVHRGQTVTTRGPHRSAKLGSVAQPFGQLEAPTKPSSSPQPAAVITRLGQGKIAATTFALGQDYLASQSAVLRLFVNDLVRELFPNPMVQVTGSPNVDVVLNRMGNRLAIHLINTAGPHRNEGILDTLPPVGPLTVTVRLSAPPPPPPPGTPPPPREKHKTPPPRLTLEPAHRPLKTNYADGHLQVTLPQLEIYDILHLEL